jgi:dihydrofolate synthase/folylpolyglutamate synthase
MSPQDPFKYLQSLTGLGIRLDLAPLRKVLSQFDHPEKHYRTVLIAGTNGKGSISAMVSSILTAAGLVTGLYTSPHLRDYRERIRVDGRMISRAELKSLIGEVRPRIGAELTYFEFTTLLAFLHFFRRKVRAAILEVGMGGRFDATNVVTPDVCVISNISLEHREFLGGSLEAIAREKGGIIKKKGICLTAARQKVVLRTLEEICTAQDARLYRLGRDIRVRAAGPGVFSYRGIHRHYDRIEVPLLGRHQVENAGLALGVVELLSAGKAAEINDQAVLSGLKAVKWEGRLEILAESPVLIVDGAHNPAGMAALRRALLDHFTNRRLILIFGVLRDKDYAGMLKKIAPAVNAVILTRPGSTDRALPPDTIREEAGKYVSRVAVIEEPEKALEEAMKIARKRDVICAAGSLYLVGAIKEIYHRRKNRKKA